MPIEEGRARELRSEVSGQWSEVRGQKRECFVGQASCLPSCCGNRDGCPTLFLKRRFSQRKGRPSSLRSYEGQAKGKEERAQRNFGLRHFSAAFLRRGVDGRLCAEWNLTERTEITEGRYFNAKDAKREKKERKAEFLVGRESRRVRSRSAPNAVTRLGRANVPHGSSAPACPA